MDALPLELVIEISTCNPIAFTRMIMADRRIYQYVCTPAGHNLFLLTCMEKRRVDKSIRTYSRITSKLHSFFDEPAVTYTGGKHKWYRHGKRHRTGRPASINTSIGIDGNQKWYHYGKLHRTDGPAILYTDGEEYWYQNGEIHRTNGPAFTYPHGGQHWYQNGKLHRIDGPAVIYISHGGDQWYRHGKPHRTDGPAVTYSDGTTEWWIDGVKQVAPNNLHTIAEMV